MRVGMIGAGAMAARHLTSFTDMNDIDVVAHLSISPTRAASHAERFGGQAFESLDSFVRLGRPDAVWIAVPPSQHGDIEQRLIEDRIPFLVEKPLSVDRTTAESIGESLSRHPLVTAVGYQWRALDTLPLVREVLSGQHPLLALGHYHTPLPAKSWWRQNRQSGGQMIEQACHLIDLARVLLGEAIVQHASAAGSWDDDQIDIAGTSVACLRFQNGALGVLTATCQLERSGPPAHLQIVCGGVSVTIDLDAVTIARGGDIDVRRTGSNPYRAQNRAFATAVATNDRAAVFCSYEDALITHGLCHDIKDAIGPPSARSPTLVQQALS